MIDIIKFINSRFSSNTYIISHSKYNNIWVVDPGDTRYIFDWMSKNKKTVITGILLTHTHFDHIYGINEIVGNFPSCVVFVANEYGLESLKNPKINGSKFTEEGPIMINDNAIVQYCENEMWLWDEINIQSFRTQGHSDDSLCLLLDNMLFTGDTLIKNVRTVTKLKGGSVEKLKESFKLIAKLKGKNLNVMPGHGDEFSLDKYDLNKMIQIIKTN